MARAHRSYETRKACLAEADRTGNVRAACRVFNISPTTFYAWKRRADRYGLAGLHPRSRRRPTQPNQTPPWQTEIVLAEAISRPTLGPARLLEHLEERGVELSASGVHKVLARHGLSRATDRVGALAQITAAADGTATEEALEASSGSATSRRIRAIWPLWTPSTWASSRAWGRCGSSPRSTPRPAGR